MSQNHQPGNGRRFYLDELAVGQAFESASHRVDASEMIAYARQFDPQPFHLDDAAARDTLFGGLAASGWYTASLTMRLIVGGGLPLMGGIIGSGGEITWPLPTRAGDTLRVVSEVLELVPSRSRPDRGRVKMRCETRNQRGEAVQILIANLVVPKRPA
jgi:acyl dehydratase